MEKRRICSLAEVMFGILILVLAMAMPQTPAYGAVNCATATYDADFDNDGFSDKHECEGLPLWDQIPFPGKNSGVARANRLDPDTKDLFVIWEPAPSGLFPSNPMEYVANTLAAGGLAIALHVITPSQASPTRLVSAQSTQKAIRVVESLDTSNPLVLGQAPVGNPNSFNDTFDEATIFTQNIRNNIMTKCGNRFGTTNCADTTGAIGDSLVNKYIKHTIAHEIGHMVILRYLNLTNNTDYRTYSNIGYHYPDGTLVILDQFVKATDKSGKVTFSLGIVYTSADQTNFKLK